MTCPPVPQPPQQHAPSACLPSDPLQRLALFEEALFVLASGQQKTEVRHGEYFPRYGSGSVPYLEREVARLRAITGRRTGITIGRSIEVTTYPPASQYRKFSPW